MMPCGVTSPQRDTFARLTLAPRCSSCFVTSFPRPWAPPVTTYTFPEGSMLDWYPVEYDFIRPSLNNYSSVYSVFTHFRVQWESGPSRRQVFQLIHKTVAHYLPSIIWLVVCVRTRAIDRGLIEICRDIIEKGRDIIKIGRDIISTNYITGNWSQIQ